MAEVLAQTHPSLYRATGFADWLGANKLEHSQRVTIVTVVRHLCTVSWAAATIGMFMPLTPILTALSLLVLWGLGLGAMGIHHDWTVATLTMLLLSFGCVTDQWSVDYWIGRKKFPRSTNPRLSETGVWRQLVSVLVFSSLFSAGMAKLLESGFSWTDGTPLKAYLREANPLFPALNAVLDEPGIIVFLSLLTLATETLAPIGLIFRSFRIPILLFASFFHLGVWLLMGIFYLPQTICYLVCIRWSKERVAHLPNKLGSRQRLVLVFGTAMVVALFANAFLRIEWWPLSNIPMYSAYPNPAPFEDLDSLREVVRRCYPKCSWTTEYEIRKRMAVEIVLADGSTLDVRPGLKSAEQPLLSWSRILGQVGLKGFVEPTEANDWLESIRPLLESRFQELSPKMVALVYRAKEGNLPIAAIAW